MAKHYVSNKDESVRIFRNGVLEFFTHVHWTVPLVLYVPVVVALLVAGGGALAASQIALNVAFGLALWTVVEYFGHRYFFHAGPKIETEVRDIVAALPPGEPALRHMKTFRQKHYFLAHGVHHDFPNDTKRLVLPPSVSIPLAIAFFFLFRVVLGPGMGPTVYDTIHYAVHHFSLHSRALLYLKKHHYRHHYNDSTKDFGVSSPVWDFVLGTASQRAK
jgi:sterol desaturase/sphingolipid hydroxylase (fatty acid hydroxylase superfamily)